MPLANIALRLIMRWCAVMMEAMGPSACRRSSTASAIAVYARTIRGAGKIGPQPG